MTHIFLLPPYPAGSAENSVLPPEFDGYIHLHFYGFSVENIRLISPLFHRIHGGHDQQRMTADQTQALNRAIAGDDRMKFYVALYSGPFGNDRILRHNLADQQPFIERGAPDAFFLIVETRVAWRARA